MKSQAKHTYSLTLLLFVVGFGLFFYRHLALDVPLSENKSVNSWTVEANLKFTAERDRPVQARFMIPNSPAHFVILDEYFVSQNYGVMTNLRGNNREAVWSLRRSTGPQSLYYRAIFREADAQSVSNLKSSYPKKQQLPDNQKAAVETIIKHARASSADIQTFAQSTIQILNQEDGNAKLLVEGDMSDKARVDALIKILAEAKIEAMPIQGVYLKQENRAQMKWYLTVYNGNQWLFINPQTGVVGLPKHFLIWTYGQNTLFEVSGGQKPSFSLSVSPTPMNALSVAKMRGLQAESKLMRFSLLELPVHIQETYKILLMIPLGAFIILLLRNWVGLKTFGTFMPVLIALAFRETDLIWGIVLFSTIVALGLLVRFYLDELRLLLVPRLNLILSVVIMVMLFISVISQNLNLSSGLSVALFPMIILTMTIERMCITWDERGALEALSLGAGSLFAAVCTYLVMNIRAISYLLFAFPELLLVLMAVTLWFGQYKGYRLTELFRFKALSGA